MLTGPFPDWKAAVAFCGARRLMIVQHDWEDGKLYVTAVPYPAARNFR